MCWQSSLGGCPQKVILLFCPLPIKAGMPGWRLASTLLWSSAAADGRDKFTLSADRQLYPLLLSLHQEERLQRRALLGQHLHIHIPQCLEGTRLWTGMPSARSADQGCTWHSRCTDKRLLLVLARYRGKTRGTDWSCDATCRWSYRPMWDETFY